MRIVMALPVLDLGNDPRLRGCVHGEELKDDISHNIDVYLTRFKKLGFSIDKILAESKKWVPKLRSFDSEFFDELEGVAIGSGCDFTEIVMLNVRYELIISMFKQAEKHQQSGAVDGCTSFAILPEKTISGDTLLGQTWDWIPGVKTMISRVKREEKTNFICHGEIGTIGGMQGLNDAGIGVVINAMMCTDDGENLYEKPFRIRVREILNSKNMHEAILAVCGTKRTVSMNFIIGHVDGEAIDLEVAPNKEGYVYPTEGILTHSNHFCGLDVDSEVVRIWPNTMYRHERLRRLFQQSQQLDEQTARYALSDHFGFPHSICAHLDTDEHETMQLETCNAIILSLKHSRLSVTDGQPCSNNFQEVSFNA
ncbi:MAG: hypothetical protein CMM30_02465 [Rhodospirillaceae bacterium]|nr:hypothetical protein [Alphaproteobacteria bacterium]MBR71790.1 hypothetical protein [Rhodospirillaceae bacterium]